MHKEKPQQAAATMQHRDTGDSVICIGEREVILRELCTADCCLEYLILRGAMAYDPRQNVWKGPTPQSGYIVKMDAMKDTQDNMFESSIK